MAATIPAGVPDGTTLRLRGQGEAGVRGGADGDLFVRVSVQEHDLFTRDGDDLRSELAVPLTQAVLGAEIPIQTIDGKEVVQVPPGTQDGTVLRVRDAGVPHLDGRGRGDLLVHVSVNIPRRLSTEERQLFENLAALRGEEVAPEQRGLFHRLRDSIRGQ